MAKGKKTGGRQAGTPNKGTAQKRLDAKAASGEVLEDPAYRRNFRKRARQGKLAPAVEAMLWAYYYGRPVERQEVGKPGDFRDPSTMSKAEIDAEIEALHRKHRRGSQDDTGEAA